MNRSVPIKIFLAASLLVCAACGAGSGEPGTSGGNIPPPNTAPVTTDLAAETAMNFSFGGYLPGGDPDGPTRVFSIVSDGTAGTAVVTNALTGEFVYTPDTDVTGTDSFTFQLSDSLVTSNISTVTVEVLDDFQLRLGTVTGDPVSFSVQLPPSAATPGLTLGPPSVPGEFGCETTLVPPSRFDIACTPLSDTAVAPQDMTLTGTGAGGTGNWSGTVSLEVLARSTDLQLAPNPATPLLTVEGLATAQRNIDATLSANLVASGSGPVAFRLTDEPDGFTCTVAPDSLASSGTVVLSCDAVTGSSSGTVVIEAISTCGASVSPSDTIETVKAAAVAACPAASTDPTAPFIGRAQVDVTPEAPTLVVQPAQTLLNLTRSGPAGTDNLSVTSSNTDVFYPATVSVVSFPAGIVCTLPDGQFDSAVDTAQLSCTAASNSVAGVIHLDVTPAAGPVTGVEIAVSVATVNFSLLTDDATLFPVENSFVTGNAAITPVSPGPASTFTGPAVLSILSAPSGIDCQFGGDASLANLLDSDTLECTAHDSASDGYVVIQAVSADAETASTAVGIVRLPPLLQTSQTAAQIHVPGSINVGIGGATDPELKYPVTVAVIAQPAGAGCLVNSSTTAQLASIAESVTLNCSGSVTGNVGIRYTSSNTDPVVAEISIPLVSP